MKFYVYKDFDGKWYWNLKGRGKAVAFSRRGYSSKGHAHRALINFLNQAEVAEIIIVKEA